MRFGLTLASHAGSATSKEAAPQINLLTLKGITGIQHVFPSRSYSSFTHENDEQILISAVELFGPSHAAVIYDGTNHLYPSFWEQLFQQQPQPQVLLLVDSDDQN